MKMLPLSQIQQPLSLEKGAKATADTTGFGEVFKKSLESVNSTVQEAARMTEGLVAGEHSNIHETMIAMEKSTVSTRLLTRVQQKVIAAYQDVMRMQV
jgi:flagellar hook-basal body complex protein FliE